MLSSFLRFRPYFFLLSFLFVGFFFFAHPASAAIRTWDGGGTDGTCGGAAGDGNKWSCAANWSTDTAPVSGDVATFNATSTKDATVDSTVNVGGAGGLSIAAGYTGTITQNSGIGITIGTTGYVQADGVFIMGTNGTITNTGPWTHTAGGTFTSGSSSTVTFNPSTGRTINVNSTETFYNLTFSPSVAGRIITINTGDTLIVNGAFNYTEGSIETGTVDARGVITVGAGADGGASTGTITSTTSFIPGAIASTIAAGATMPIFTSSNSDQTITLTGSGTVTFSKAVTLNAGVISAGSVNATFSTTTTIAGGTINAGSGTVTFSTTLAVSSGTFNGDSATVTHTGGLTISSTGTYNTTTGTTTINQNYTHTSGTCDCDNGTVLYNANFGDGGTWNINSTETFNNLTLSPDSGGVILTLGASDTLIVNGTFTYNEGSIDVGTIDARGVIAVGAGADGGGSMTTGILTSTTSFTPGAIASTIAAGAAMPTFTLANSDQTVTFTGSGTVGFARATILSAGTLTAGSVNVNFSSTSSTLTISGGTFNAGSGTATFTAAFSQTSGTFNGETAALDFNGTWSLSGGTFTSTSGSMTLDDTWTHTTGTFAHNNGTVTADSGTLLTWDFPTSETFYNFTLNTGSTGYNFDIASGDNLIVLHDFLLTNGALRTGTAEARGNVTIASTFDGGTATLTFTGSSASGSAIQTFDLTGATGTFNADITINKSEGEVDLASALVMDNSNQDLTIQEGTFDLSGFALTVAGGATETITVESGGNLQLQGGETITADSTTYPDFQSGSTATYDGTAASYTVQNFTDNYHHITFAGAASTVFSMGSVETFDGNLTITTGIFSLAGSNLTVTGTYANNDTFRLRGSETVSLTMDTDSGLTQYVGDGDSAADTFTLKDFGSTDYYNLSIPSVDTADIYQSAGAKVIAGTFTISLGTYDANGQTTTSTGLVTVSGGTYSASTATQTFNAGLTVSGGTYTGSSGTADVNGTFTLSSGVFTAPTAMTVSASFTHSSGTFTHNSGTVTLDGTSQTISGATTFNNFTKTVSSAATLTFPASVTQTFVGTLTLQGALGQRLSLRSSITDTQALIDPQGSRSVQYLDVKDNNNANVTTITCSVKCASSGNNTNWTISIAGITVSTISGNTTEAGATATFTIVLDAGPSADVTVSLSSNDTTEGTIAVSSVVFTDSNWSTPQTVTVTGVNDDLDDGDIAYSIVTAAATSSDTDYDTLNAANVSATNTDNDSSGFTVGTISGTVSESGTTATYTVVLTAQPTADVTFGITSSDTTEGTVSPSSLTFTNVNWATPQTVTVTGANDFIIDGTIAFSLVNAAATSVDTNYNGLNPSDVSASCTDNDVAGITVSTISGNTTEAGVTATFTIVLISQPTTDVTVPLSSNDTTEGTIAVSSVVFTDSNWSTPQTITVTGVNDDLDDGDIAYSIVTAAATSADSNYNTLNASNVSVTNTDNDTAGITVGTISGNTTEAGVTATFTVVLTSQPTADVNIGVTSNDTTEGTIVVSTLTFTSGNWSSAQTVTVTGVNDDVDDGDIAYSIVTAAATSADSNYNTLNAADVSVTNTDNDTAGVTVSAISGNTTEAGVTATFTVVLNTQPTGNVEINSAENDATEGSVTGGTILTFTTLTWATPQTVTVTGQDDDVDDGNIAYTIVVTVDASDTADALYDAINPSDVSATNTDNDTAAFVVTESGGTTGVNEGSSGNTDTFTVVLSSQPVSDVVFSITSSDTLSATVDSATLTFTSGNWSTAQTVTVSSVSDANSTSETPIITISVTDASSDDTFDALADQTVSVAVTDDDGGGDGDDEAIVPPLVYLLNPIAADEYLVGDIVSLYWDASTAIENLAFQVRIHRTTSWRTVFETEELTGMYDWTIPTRYEDTVLDARIIGYAILDGAAVKDSHDSLFDIQALSDGTGELDDGEDEDEDIDSETDTEEDASESCAFDTGSYIKLDWLSTVYYVDEGCVRRPFMNATAYFTYESDWSPVEVVEKEDFSTSRLGLLMPPKPETVLVKIESTPEVYALEVSDDASTIAILRWVPTEEVAQTLFGTDWDLSVIDVSPAFFTRFGFGSSLTITYTGNTDLYAREDLANR